MSEEIVPQENEIRDGFFVRMRKGFVNNAKHILLSVDVMLSIILTVVFNYLIHHKEELVELKDISAYCELPYYNKKIIAGGEWGRWSMIVNYTFMFIIFLMLYWRIHMYYKNLSKTIEVIATVTWVITIGIISMAVLGYIVQIYAGVPRPYYFQNADLNRFYCTERFEMNSTLTATDQELRMSFPSLNVAVESFFSCLTAIFYIDFDISFGPHTYQGVIGLFFAVKCFLHGIFDYYDHIHHFSDIFFGIIIGISFGTITGRAIYGSFGCRTIIKPLYWFPTIDIDSSSEDIPMAYLGGNRRGDVDGNEYQEDRL